VTRKRPAPRTPGEPAPANVPARDPKRELAEIDAVFKALAHPSRRHVMLVLHYRGGEMTAGEIASRFACSWPTTTRHLRVLQEAGLLRVFRRGRERIYTVDQEKLERIAGRWLRLFDDRLTD
jgi:DNA-binding transcriptional ArsR family regulator